MEQHGFDFNTDEKAEAFLRQGYDEFTARNLVGLYRCARGPIEHGGRGLGILDALEHVLKTYLKIQEGFTEKDLKNG